MYVKKLVLKVISLQLQIPDRYSTARFKLFKNSRVNYTQHYTSLKIFVACLRALGKVMTSPTLVASKHTCYKLVASLSTRAHNVNALDMCHTRNQLERVFPL